jgi:hypothetical protein
MKDLLEALQNKTENDDGCYPTKRMIDKDFVRYNEFGNENIIL